MQFCGLDKTVGHGKATVFMLQRNAIFISHAAPEDNSFTLWLGAKLSALGYEVWADVLRLSGGEDWQRKLETAIRERACKVLLAANAHSVQNQGVRNEIQLASDTAKKIGDHEFIIPLRLGPFDAPFLIAHAQYIDFELSWAQGLQELISVLEERYAVPKLAAPNTDIWMSLQLSHSKSICQTPELLVSNWLEVRRTPPTVFYAASVRRESNSTIPPSVSFKDGILTCDDVYRQEPEQISTNDFLQSGWPKLGIRTDDARKLFTNLANQAIDRVLQSKGLTPYAMANKQICWWLGEGVPDGRIAFKWEKWKGSRQLQGFSSKRNVYWHFGVSMSFRSAPVLHVRVRPRLIFTEDKKTPLRSATRMHRLRRSFAKGWRNARWRDMLLAFFAWLENGSTLLDVAMGATEDLVLTIPSMSFTSPFSIPAQSAPANQDLDDPEIDSLDDEELHDED